MTTLLQKAKSLSSVKPPARAPKYNSKELEELSVQWLKGKITTRQVAYAIGHSGSSLYSMLAVNIKHAYEKGKIKD